MKMPHPSEVFITMPKRQAQTVHGEFEYETVECSSCDTEVAKEDAHRFIVARKVRSKYGEKRIPKAGVTAEGWACEYCREEGPISFPTPSIRQTIPDLDPMTWMIVVWLSLMALLIVSEVITSVA